MFQQPSPNNPKMAAAAAATPNSSPLFARKSGSPSESLDSGIGSDIDAQKLLQPFEQEKDQITNQLTALLFDFMKQHPMTYNKLGTEAFDAARHSFKSNDFQTQYSKLNTLANQKVIEVGNEKHNHITGTEIDMYRNLLLQLINTKIAVENFYVDVEKIVEKVSNAVYLHNASKRHWSSAVEQLHYTANLERIDKHEKITLEHVKSAENYKKESVEKIKNLQSRIESRLKQKVKLLIDLSIIDFYKVESHNLEIEQQQLNAYKVVHQQNLKNLNKEQKKPRWFRNTKSIESLAKRVQLYSTREHKMLNSVDALTRKVKNFMQNGSLLESSYGSDKHLKTLGEKIKFLDTDIRSYIKLSMTCCNEDIKEWCTEIEELNDKIQRYKYVGNIESHALGHYRTKSMQLKKAHEELDSQRAMLDRSQAVFGFDASDFDKTAELQNIRQAILLDDQFKKQAYSLTVKLFLLKAHVKDFVERTKSSFSPVIEAHAMMFINFVEDNLHQTFSFARASS